jgi:hypothetical protein
VIEVGHTSHASSTASPSASFAIAAQATPSKGARRVRRWSASATVGQTSHASPMPSESLSAWSGSPSTGHAS